MENTSLSRYCDFLQAKLPAWKGLTSDQITFCRFNSLTNIVYKVTAMKDDVTPNPVVLRNFCSQEGIIDRDKESKIFIELSNCGLGPKGYVQEKDIRLEEYVQSRNIKSSEYKERIMRRKLAKALAAIHKLEIPTISKDTIFDDVFGDPDFFKQFEQKCDQNIYSESEKKVIQKLKTASSTAEIEFVKRIIPTEKTVFCHNDLLQGNILITEREGDVLFIDYEYASYNFRGFDIGSLCSETMMDYTHPEPPYFGVIDENRLNEEELRDLLRYYIIFSDMDAKQQKEKADSLINDDKAVEIFIKENYDMTEFKERENILYKNTQIGIMLSCYYYIFWGVNMCKTSDIKFDYLEWALFCYDEYEKLKKEVLNME